MKYADADLVTAIVKRRDHLKKRAEAVQGLRVSFGVGIELLFVARKHDIPCVDFLGAAARRFTIENQDILFTAAEALDNEEISTVFDAIHASTAFHAGTVLVTTDKKLQASPFPTKGF